MSEKEMGALRGERGWWGWEDRPEVIKGGLLEEAAFDLKP